jgi:hypothetical protein
MVRFWAARDRCQRLIATVAAAGVALQMLLAGLAAIQLSPGPASSAIDPFVICFGHPTTPADHQTPIDHPPHQQHCVLCTIAAASAAIFPTITKDAVRRAMGLSVHWSTATIVPIRHFSPRLSQGPPRGA